MQEGGREGEGPGIESGRSYNRHTSHVSLGLIKMFMCKDIRDARYKLYKIISV